MRGPGKGVDSQGGPVIDPTENVMQLVKAAVERQDDLRKANEALTAAQVAHLRLTEELRAAHLSELMKLTAEHTERARNMEARRIDEQVSLRATYEEALREKEAKRIDAIRAVDVGAVAVASERATQQAAVLANQVTASADTLRTLVATTATTQAQQLTQLTTQLTDRLSSLEKSQYENKGRSGVYDPQVAELVAEVKSLRETAQVGTGKSDITDPMLSALMSEVKTLRESQQVGTGKTQGISSTWAILIAVVSVALAVGSFILKSSAPSAVPNGGTVSTPQIIYVPAPSSASSVPGAVNGAGAPK